MVKNQHYIPEFYLKRFGKNEKIDVYDIKNKKFILNTNVSNFACRRFFYDTEPDNIRETLSFYKEIGFITEKELEEKIKEPQFIEKALSRLESKMSIDFNEFEKNNGLINNDDFLRTLFIFIHTLSIRTANYRKSQENILEQISNWKTLNTEDYQLNIEHKEIAKQNQLNSILSLPILYEKALCFFDKYDIFVGINNTDVDFIISDNLLFGFYLGFNDICFPVNPKLAIIIQVAGVDKKFKICNVQPDKENKIFLKSTDVISYNTFQECSNANFLFGNESSLKFHLNFINSIKNKN